MKVKTVLSREIDLNILRLLDQIESNSNSKEDLSDYKKFCTYLVEKLIQKDIFSYVIIEILNDIDIYKLYKNLKEQDTNIESYIIKIITSDANASFTQNSYDDQLSYLVDAKIMKSLDKIERHILNHITINKTIDNITFEDLKNAHIKVANIIISLMEESITKRWNKNLIKHPMIEYLDELLYTPKQINNFIVKIIDISHNTKDKNLDYIDLFYKILDSFNLDTK